MILIMENTEPQPEPSFRPFGWKQTILVVATTIITGTIAITVIRFVPDLFWSISDFESEKTGDSANVAHASAVNQARIAIGVTTAATLAFAAAVTSAIVSARNIEANAILQRNQIRASQIEQQESLRESREQQRVTLESARTRQAEIMEQQAEESTNARFAELTELLESPKEAVRFGALTSLARIALRNRDRVQDVIDILSGHLRYSLNNSHFGSHVISTICEILPDRPTAHQGPGPTGGPIKLNLDQVHIPALEIRGKRVELSARKSKIPGGIRVVDCMIEGVFDVREAETSGLMILDECVLNGNLNMRRITVKVEGGRDGKIEISDSLLNDGIDLFSGDNSSSARLLIKNSRIIGAFRTPDRLTSLIVRKSTVSEIVDLSNCPIKEHAEFIASTFENGLNLDLKALELPGIRTIDITGSDFCSELTLPSKPDQWSTISQWSKIVTSGDGGVKSSLIVRH